MQQQPAAAAAAMLPQLPGCPPESAALAHTWEFTFSKSCRDQKPVCDRETVEGDFDLAPFIKILPEKELLLCYCSRPENHRAKWWHSFYVETMLFTRWVIKMSFWGSSEVMKWLTLTSEPISLLFLPHGDQVVIKVITLPLHTYAHPYISWLQ